MINIPDENPEDVKPPDPYASQAGEWHRPPVTWRGEALHPYSELSRSLLLMAFSENDRNIYRALAFIHAHRKRGGKTAKEDMQRHITPLVFDDINRFRTEVLETRAGLTLEEEAAALKIYETEETAYLESRFKARPASSGGIIEVQKKSPGTSPAKRPGLPSNSRRKRG